jgi:hypothetical protein
MLSVMVVAQLFLAASDVPVRDEPRLLEQALRIDERFPTSSLAMAMVGASFGPAFTLIGGLMLGVGVAVIPTFILPGALILATGGGGIALMVYGLMRGSAAVDEARSRREALLLGVQRNL